MPVTAKLSKAFYDRVGEQAANELVDWFNAVDATYRAELRELNELNFARFDAKLEQRLAEVRADFSAKLSEKLAELRLDQRFAEVRAEFGAGFAELRMEMNTKLAAMEATLERRLGDQTRWMFVAWATLMVAVIGFGLRR